MSKINEMSDYKVILIVHGKINKKILKICEDRNLKLLKWPSPSPIYLRDALFFLRMILKYKPICIIASMRPTNIMILVSFLCNIKNRIIWIRSGLPKKEKNNLRTFLKKIIFQMSNGILSVSKNISLMYNVKYSIKDKRKLILHNLISDPLKGEPYSLEQREKIILSVGRLVPEKGHSTLLNAYSTIINKYGHHVKLVIVGDGPYRSHLENQTKNLMITNTCKLLGSMPYEQLHEYYKKALVTIIPSECHESFGYAIIESMAFGTPVIASNIGGIPEVINHGQSGLLFASGNPDELAKSIDQILSDYDLWFKVNKNSRDAFLKTFNIESSIDHYAKLFTTWLG
tara:strand:+ start:264 stop:1292 length:1029 start_codon:yes stop_codon:yes gene_type:complete